MTALGNIFRTYCVFFSCSITQMNKKPRNFLQGQNISGNFVTKFLFAGLSLDMEKCYHFSKKLYIKLYLLLCKNHFKVFIGGNWVVFISRAKFTLHVSSDVEFFQGQLGIASPPLLTNPWPATLKMVLRRWSQITDHRSLITTEMFEKICFVRIHESSQFPGLSSTDRPWQSLIHHALPTAVDRDQGNF